MGKCNLKLELSVTGRNGAADQMEEGSGESPSKDNAQPMTIFYGGRVGTYDVSELQARAILMLAGYEMRKLQDKSGAPAGSIQQRLGSAPVTGLSMKASLQRFLQKRRLRAQARSPY
uniref:Protein TIFY n=1 Tax=Kalanchoe fedtschenkoi TaxID=63787 RepID=A0A7N0REL6_KALFE